MFAREMLHQYCECLNKTEMDPTDQWLGEEKEPRTLYNCKAILENKGPKEW